MCMLMEAKSEIEFVENYNIFKEDYGHISIVIIYVDDVGWTCQNYYCRIMWIEFGRLIFHEFVDTTSLVE